MASAVAQVARTPIGSGLGTGRRSRLPANFQFNRVASDGIAVPGPIIDIGFGDVGPEVSAGPITGSHTNISTGSVSTGETSPSGLGHCRMGELGVHSKAILLKRLEVNFVQQTRFILGVVFDDHRNLVRRMRIIRIIVVGQHRFELGSRQPDRSPHPDRL